MIWENSSYLSGTYLDFAYKEKGALFDLDQTLIATKSRRKFPIDENDWKPFSSNVSEKINNLHATHCIVPDN